MIVGFVFIFLAFAWLLFCNWLRGRPGALIVSTVRLSWLAMIGFVVFFAVGNFCLLQYFNAVRAEKKAHVESY